MDDALILETTFLIDLERETAKGLEGAAYAFLEGHLKHRLLITPTIAGELAAGASLASRDRWEEFVAPFQILAHSRDVCWHYGETYRYLQANGRLIGANDLWIAAVGLAYDVPVVTRNAEHFGRVPGLDVATYR